MAKADDTLSHNSDLHIHNETKLSGKPNQSFIQDFFGFSTEEWSHNTSYDTSPETVNFVRKSNSSKPITIFSDDDVNKRKTSTAKETNPVFRSSSGSFRYMRQKTASMRGSWRSVSVTVLQRSRMASSSKSKSSRWQVFMFGHGSGKFPTKMDLCDIKSRQLRQQSTSDGVDMSHNIIMKKTEEKRSGKKAWWRFVDILGCGGGFVRDDVVIPPLIG